MLAACGSQCRDLTPTPSLAGQRGWRACSSLDYIKYFAASPRKTSPTAMGRGLPWGLARATSQHQPVWSPLAMVSPASGQRQLCIRALQAFRSNPSRAKSEANSAPGPHSRASCPLGQVGHHSKGCNNTRVCTGTMSTCTSRSCSGSILVAG